MRSMMVAAIFACAGGSVALALSLQGCSNSDAAPPASDAGDAGVVDAADETAVDAGPDIDQPSNVYPAQHQPIPLMHSLGGPVLPSMQLVTVTFAGAPSRDSVRAFDDAIIKSGWWTTVMTGFGVGKGTSGGYADLPNDFGVDAGASVTITDDDIHTLLQAKITSGELPRPIQGVTAYALYFPKNVSIQNGSETSCQSFGGYHYAFMANVPAPSGDAGADAGPGGTFNVPYAVMPRCDSFPNDAVTNFTQLTYFGSHELAEMASDPFPWTGFVLDTDDAWLPSFYAPGTIIENGDACSNIYDVNLASYDDPSGYSVQRIWDNAAAAASDAPCQPTKANRIYFAAAVKTDKGKFNGHDTYGYVVVPSGGSVDVVVNVFSKAELPHDALLYVGKEKQGATDPSDMGKISNTVTVALSRQQVHNGSGVIMTVSAGTASLKGQGGDQRLLVRAVLEKDDYNDWPFIVRVK